MNRIGIFDSGLGGLSIVNSLRSKLPLLDIAYLGDTARLPYGTKSPETIKSYVTQNVDFLKNQNVDMVIVACNSASTVLDDLNFDIPVIGVIDSGAIAALKSTENKNIGVIGTRATINSKCYKKALMSEDHELKIYTQICPLFVPLVEEGLVDDPLTRLLVFRYLSGFQALDIDTLILGCTHYRFLQTAISDVLGSKVRLVDASEVLIDVLSKRLQSSKGKGELVIQCTDTEDHFKTMIDNFLETPDYSLEHIRL